MAHLSMIFTQWKQMYDHVAAVEPIEACGLLAGIQSKVYVVIPVPNELNSPVRYRFAPVDHLNAFRQIEEAGLELLAIYHSHPNGPQYPSATDIDEAAYDVTYIIWSPSNHGEWYSRGFWISGNSYTEVPLYVEM
jgi:proteasome lid subunit RPN8/RPN11